MKRLLSIVIACLLLCGSVAAGAERPKILVIPKGMRVQYWQWVEQGAKNAGRDRNVEIIYRGPWASDDFLAQLEIIKVGLKEDVDAIVIAPNHTSRAAPLLAQAVARGITVVLMDSDMEFEERISLVASDNHRAGRQGGEYLLSLLDGKGAVLLLRYARDNASTLEREEGFQDAVSDSPQGHRFIDTDYVGVSVGAAYHAVMDILEANPDIQGIFSPGEATTLGALKALRDLDLAGKVKIVGFDYTKEIHDALEDGSLDATVMQSPYQIGYQGVMAACDALEGKPVERRIVTRTYIMADPNELSPANQ